MSEAGTAFAIPAQTSYLAQAPGLDVERGKEAESRVEQWRAEDRLPFPEFDAQEREAMTDVLDYPPQGSPGYSLRQNPSGGREDEPPERRSDSSWLRPRRKRPNP